MTNDEKKPANKLTLTTETIASLKTQTALKTGNFWGPNSHNYCNTPSTSIPRQ